MGFGRRLIVATALLAVASCGREIPVVDKETLQNQIFERLATEWGHNPQKVTCPAGLRGEIDAEQTCVVTNDGVDYHVTATVTGVEGDAVEFKIKTGEALTVETPTPEVYVGRDDVARTISEQVAQQAGAAPELVNCPNDRPAVLDAAVTCYLHNGSNVYDVAVKVTTLEGDNVGYDIHVAPEPR